MDKNELKAVLQERLSPGLMVVVGSGASAAEGLPTMGQLANYLMSNVPISITPSDIPSWSIVEQKIRNGDGLEKALDAVPLSPELLSLITHHTANCIREPESIVIREAMSGKRLLPMQVLINHLFKPATTGTEYHVLTPNYDRLIEVSAELSGIGVDSRFVGYTVGTLDAKRSSDAHRESYFDSPKRGYLLRSSPRLCVHKPHGSLDWYMMNGKPIRSPFELDDAPLIVTPGLHKYRDGYAVQFDEQRRAANAAVARAMRFLFLGYGFNDDHLESQLCPSKCLSKDAIIVARDLTDNARQVIQNSGSAIALSRGVNDNETNVTMSDGSHFSIDEDMWSVRGFVKGTI